MKTIESKWKLLQAMSGNWNSEPDKKLFPLMAPTWNPWEQRRKWKKKQSTIIIAIASPPHNIPLYHDSRYPGFQEHQQYNVRFKFSATFSHCNLFSSFVKRRRPTTTTRTRKFLLSAAITSDNNKKSPGQMFCNRCNWIKKTSTFDGNSTIRSSWIRSLCLTGPIFKNKFDSTRRVQ